MQALCPLLSPLLSTLTTTVPAASLPLFETVSRELKQEPLDSPGAEPLVTTCPPIVIRLSAVREPMCRLLNDNVPPTDTLPEMLTLLLTVRSWVIVTGPCSVVVPATDKLLRRAALDKVLLPLTFSVPRVVLPAST